MTKAKPGAITARNIARMSAKYTKYRVILRRIWEQGKHLINDGQGCMLCIGEGYLSIEVGGHIEPAARFLHSDGCQWNALDATMKEIDNDAK